MDFNKPIERANLKNVASPLYDTNIMLRNNYKQKEQLYIYTKYHMELHLKL